MIGFLQRVSSANVAVDNQCVGTIEQGLLVLVGVAKTDRLENVRKLIDKLLHYRVFADGQGRMNKSLVDVRGGLLLVPQFTLLANTGKGLRPSFAAAAAPELAQQLFEEAVQYARLKYPVVESGRFGADMQVSLVNDGPVSFWLEM